MWYVKDAMDDRGILLTVYTKTFHWEKRKDYIFFKTIKFHLEFYFGTEYRNPSRTGMLETNVIKTRYKYVFGTKLLSLLFMFFIVKEISIYHLNYHILYVSI